MTDSFLPRPSPNPHDVFDECDANTPLRGQPVMLIYEDQEGHGGAYISGQGAWKKGEDPGVPISNHHLLYPRAANARPKSPSPVSCFILFVQSTSFIAILCKAAYSLPSPRGKP